MIDPNAPNIVTSIVSAETVEPDQIGIGVGSESDRIASGSANRDDDKTVDQVTTSAVPSPAQVGSATSVMLDPLLGTSYSQSIENARGSSERRSPESVCYDKLLRENDQSSGGKSRKNVLIERRDCYPPNWGTKRPAI
ncbi:hypothetical protein [Sphingopyxis sp. YF1]|uniref:hypothetical protein n=1 Tax=Sphingopyxis sp. YF1 TaxID=2482763 RepID=UPI001F617418|nr:hypothetical protein [Sphingopyxis sp. YF1]